jgi:hypothetical protein
MKGPCPNMGSGTHNGSSSGPPSGSQSGAGFSGAPPAVGAA